MEGELLALTGRELRRDFGQVADDEQFGGNRAAIRRAMTSPGSEPNDLTFLSGEDLSIEFDRESALLHQNDVPPLTDVRVFEAGLKSQPEDLRVRAELLLFEGMPSLDERHSLEARVIGGHGASVREPWRRLKGEWGATGPIGSDARDFRLVRPKARHILNTWLDLRKCASIALLLPGRPRMPLSFLWRSRLLLLRSPACLLTGPPISASWPPKGRPLLASWPSKGRPLLREMRPLTRLPLRHFTDRSRR